MQNYDIQIEQQILSTILFNYEKFEKFNSLINYKTFAYEAHQHIYIAMDKLFKSDLPIDEDYIKKTLEKENKFNESVLINVLTATSISNPLQYIKDLQKKHIERESKSLAFQLQKDEISIEQLQTKLLKVQNLYQIEKKETNTTNIDLEQFSPFIQDTIMELHKINEHPISMILSTVLTSMSGLIGARAKVSNGMFEVFPVIWSIIIAPSSLATKSTLTKYTKKCIFGSLQDDLFEEYKGKIKNYKEEKKAYNDLPKEDKRNNIEPEKPEPQLLIFQNDGTPEAKLHSLRDNQNGGVVYYDEMRAELEKTNNDKTYKALKTAMFEGERHHKKLVNGGSILLDRPVLCENGLITEQWLIDVIHKDDIASGFMARYLFSYNQKEDFKPLKLKPLNINIAKFSKVGEFIIDLFGLEREDPILFVLTFEARKYYTNWFNELSQTIFYTENNEEITASYRLTTYVLKFALISYIFNSAYKNIDIIKEDKIAIPLKYIKEAIYIMEIFRNENDKVLNLFAKNNKLHKRQDNISIKLQNKIRATKDKRITRTTAINSIRGINAKKLDELIERGLFKQETIDRAKYILEC